MGITITIVEEKALVSRQSPTSPVIARSTGIEVRIGIEEGVMMMTTMMNSECATTAAIMKQMRADHDQKTEIVHAKLKGIEISHEDGTRTTSLIPNHGNIEDRNRLDDDEIVNCVVPLEMVELYLYAYIHLLMRSISGIVRKTSMVS